MAKQANPQVALNGISDKLKEVVHNASLGIEKELQKAAQETIEVYYNSFNPKYYDRTGNLRNSYKTRITPWVRPAEDGGADLMSTITVSFSPAYMNEYTNRKSKFVEGLGDEFGHFTFEEVNKDIIFEKTLVQGFHGADEWFYNTVIWPKRDVYDAAHGAGSWESRKRQKAKQMKIPPLSRDGSDSIMDRKFNKIADDFEKLLYLRAEKELDDAALEFFNGLFGAQ